MRFFLRLVVAVALLLSIALTDSKAQVNVGDSLALVDLYNATDGPNWTDNTNWLTGTVDTWFGISVEGVRVEVIDLTNNNLVGTIPAELANITNLQYIYFSQNQLSGAIPASLGSYFNLQGLYLDNNQLSGSIPVELGNLVTLSLLDLSNNTLTGGIPTELTNLSNLFLLSLSVNQLTGPIPVGFGAASNMAAFVASFNLLTGSIPTDLGNATSLVSLQFNDNQLSGTIPSELGNLSLLGNLVLDNNSLTGPIPNELGLLNNLSMLSLSGNQLTGSIPSTLSSLITLQFLYLGNNQLSGNLPLFIGSYGNLVDLDLSTNQFFGVVPDTIGSLINLQKLWLNNNNFTGEVPSRLTNVPLNVFNISSTNICEPDNPIFTTWKGSIGNYTSSGISCGNRTTDSLALVALYNATDGLNWTNNSNWLAGNINTWNGVTLTGNRVSEIGLSGNNLNGSIPIELGNLLGLTILDLNGNQLTGTIPAELGNLANLTVFYLGGNLLTGAIPVELGNLTNLIDFYLGGNQHTGSIPLELGNLTNLTRLDLNGNQLTGSIPVELTNITSFTVFHLGNNQLTGPIPIELGNLINVTDLYLAGNQLSGSIPIELGNLINLTRLDINGNQFTGPIPVELGSLTNLTALDLTGNQLTGFLPIELGNLTSLTFLNLGYNQFTGPIPVEIGNLANLTGLFLNTNQLTGTLPVELGNLTNLTQLYLSDNQFIGTVPIELSSLVNLDNFDLSVNRFDSILNLSSLINLTITDVSRNDLTFEDIEPNMSISGTFIYSPQNQFGTADTFLPNKGDTLTLSIPVGGSANQYQWQKDGIDIPGATNDFLDLVNVGAAENGTYKLLVSSAIVPGLELESAEILVTVLGTIPSDYYWVGDGGNWTDLSHWSSTSGGVADKLILPGKLDDVYFDANSFSIPGQVVTIVGNEFEGETWRNMDWNGVTNNPTFQIRISTTEYLYNWVYGSLTFDPNMNLDFNGAEFYFVGDQDYSIDTKGLYLGDLCWLWINAPEPDEGGVSDVVCNVLSDINPAGVYLNKGTFRLNGNNLYEKDTYVWIAKDSVTFDVSGSYLDISTLYLNDDIVDAEIIDNGATIKVSTLLRTNDVNYNHLILSDSARVVQFSNSYDTLEIAAGSSVVFESDIVQNIGELYIQGTEAQPVSITATVADTAAIFSKPSGTVNANYVSIKDNIATGGASFNAYASFDLGNTDGWNFVSTTSPDKEALIALYNATDGPNWFNNTNWNTSAPINSWYGVLINDNNQVEKLYLQNNNLVGNLPSEIGDLSELTDIGLGANFGLTGPLPAEIGQLVNLDTISVSYSGLSGPIPEELFNLTNLIRLSASNCQFTGSLSPSVANLTNLKHIALWNTPLSGEIPQEFWGMTHLERIYLGTNTQTGEISQQIGEFSNLDEFWISQCNLSGTIPPEIGNARTTTLINLYNNKLSGRVPDEITNLNNLKTFSIQNNNFDYLPNLNPIDSLQSLNISNNKFTYADIVPNQNLITENTSQQPFGDSTQVQGLEFKLLILDSDIEYEEGQVYQWYKDGSMLSNGQEESYTIDDVRDSDVGVYTVEVFHPDVDSLILTRNPINVIVGEGNPPKPIVVEAFSPNNGDDINNEFIIENIEYYDQVRFLIYDVLGRLVYLKDNYRQKDDPFIGIGNRNGFGELPSGTYYYLVDVGDTKKNGTGFFLLGR